MNVTKEGITVQVGQIWEDLDKRQGGRQRRVMALTTDGMAMMGRTTDGKGITGVLIKRMHKCSTGWKLVRDAS
jgi:hypothetical protein